jgi:hypothetical protein
MARKTKGATISEIPTLLNSLFFIEQSFQTVDLSNLNMVFDFTQESPHSKAHVSDTLPLPRGGDFLQRYDIVNAPILDENKEVDYWVTGVIESWGHGMVTIMDFDNCRHYATLESVEEAAELIAAVSNEGAVRIEKELIEYVSYLENTLAA